MHRKSGGRAKVTNRELTKKVVPTRLVVRSRDLRYREALGIVDYIDEHDSVVPCYQAFAELGTIGEVEAESISC